MVTAVLCHVWKNPGINAEFLRGQGFDEDVIEALEYLAELPHGKDGESALIERMCQGPTLAIVVKIAELMAKASLLAIQNERGKSCKDGDKYGSLINALLGQLSSIGESREDWLVDF